MKTPATPAFSIVIPSLGERQNLVILLERFRHQVYRGKFEIIVVINTSKNLPLIAQLKTQYPRVKFIVEKKRGPTFARNTGFAAARYRQIIFLDDDVLVEKDYLQSAAAVLRKHPQAKLIGGKIKPTQSLINRVPSAWIEHYPWVFIKSSFGEKAKKLVFMESHFSAQLLYCREINEIKGPFNPKLGNYEEEPIGAEDYELSQRLMLKNFEVWYSPSLRATHIDYHHYGFWDIVRRQWQAGKEIALAEKLLLSDYPEFGVHTFRRVVINDFFKFLFKRKWPKWHNHDLFILAFYLRYFSYNLFLHVGSYEKN